MSENSRILDKSNLAATVIGIILTISSAAGISYVYFLDNLWQILCAVELIIILILIFVRRSNRFKNIPSVRGVSDPALFNQLLKLQFGRISTIAEQAEDGYFVVHGVAVRDTQIAIVKHAMQTSSREILGVEIVTDASILFTRNEFWQSNEDLIAGGGTIRRVFVVPTSVFEDPSLLRNFAEIINFNRSIQIHVGLRIREGIPDELIQDFTLCEGSAAIVEGRQGQLEYEMAHSTVYFRANQLKRYKDIFDTLWSEWKSQPAAAIAKEFIGDFEEIKDLSDSELSEKSKSFLEKVKSMTN